ncbi:MAG: isoprenyl transferase [Thermodesulfobacteriota bacterium]|nr:isoprenyl transferase [Thermodesulfobacteriota bacterium]
MDKSLEGLNREGLPKHIAIIMDGNGRWAKRKRKSRIFGHEKGSDTVREVVRTCRKLGIEVLTLYAFSMENWDRPALEVNALMSLLKQFLVKELDEMLDNSIRLMAIGNLERLPNDVYAVLQDTIQKTEKCNQMTLNLALSYGGRNDILRAVKKVIDDFKLKKITREDITLEVFSNYLYTSRLPDPDLLIRTSGERRISNFLLWQIAYTEIYITDTLWPDFTKEDLINAIIDFQNRERRFGLTTDQIKGVLE